MPWWGILISLVVAYFTGIVTGRALGLVQQFQQIAGGPNGGASRAPADMENILNVLHQGTAQRPQG